MSCGDDTSSSLPQDADGSPMQFWIEESQQQFTDGSTRSTTASDLTDEWLQTFLPQTFETTTDVEGHSFIVEASTIEGVNPTSQEGNPLERVVRDTASSHVSMKASRATPKTTIDADFSVLATRGVNSSEYAFHNQKVSKEGELYNVQFWERNDPKRKFYAFFPWALSTTNG